MTASPLTLTVHPSEFPARVRASLLQGLRGRRLPGKWLYHSPAQAARWLAFHQAFSPSRRDEAVATLYERAFASAAGAAKAREAPALHVVGLGCGGGNKDAVLLEALRSGSPGQPLHYTPLDGSPALVLESTLLVAAQNPAVFCHPTVADLADTKGLAEGLAAQPHAPVARIYTCFGILPNFQPEPLLETLARLTRPVDHLLLSVNLSPTGMEADEAAILPQYDNPPAMEWYRGALRELGLGEEEVYLSIGARPLRPDGSVWRVEVTARFRRDLVLSLFGEQIPFSEGETLEVFFSNRLTVAAVLDLLVRSGLNCREHRIDPTGEEGIFFCEREEKE